MWRARDTNLPSNQVARLWIQTVPAEASPWKPMFSGLERCSMLWCRLHNIFDQKTLMESYHNHTALVQNRRTFGFEAVDSTIVKTQRSGSRTGRDLFCLDPQLRFSLC